ncbi:MAG: amino acid adenylation domain-containing protein [Methylovulum sp.]|nr:amino acid adenylation domain-containing protein [Methylovulum sp.]
MPQASLINNETSRNNRAKLILQLNKNNAAGKPITKRPPDMPAPLSYAQERLWIMSQLEPGNPIYNMAGVIRFDGALNREALQQSLDEVIRRHEILRSRFVGEFHQAVQCVMPDNGLALLRLDLTGVPSSCFQDCAAAFNRAPFDLSSAPPLRGMLATLEHGQYRLVLVLHHIVADRWSVGVLMNEVAALYAAFSTGLPSSLPEPAIQYGDYAAWQRQQTERNEKHLGYWLQKLHDTPPLLGLPTDHPRPPVQGYRGAGYGFEIAQPLSTALNVLGKQHNATLFMVMAAAFTSVLHRYSGSNDITVGYPVAGRNQLQTAGLIGFFVNTLVLRCRLSGGLSFAGLLAEIREQSLQDMAHQDFSFGQLVETLNPRRHAGHAPLFQVMLAVQNVPTTVLQMPGLTATPEDLDIHTAQFDLTLFIEETDGQLRGVFEYNTDLFDAATLARMAGHLQTLLAGAACDPHLPITQLPLLTTQEHRQVLFDWNRPAVAKGQDKDLPLVHQLFEAQAKATPEKTALVFAGQSLSYGELDRRVSLLADKLNACGMGAESRVGVSAERSLELIVGLLAVLKAGAAYVPLDPSYPSERLDYMLHDAGIGLLLTQSHLASQFRQPDIKMLFLDSPGSTTLSTDAPLGGQQSATARNTAYIIYTSGSTGLPKGVPVSHGNLLQSTLTRTDYYQDPVSCFLLLSSFAFDSSVAGIFWTLIQGGCLCLPQQDELADPVALAQLIERWQVSHLLALPSFYTAILTDSTAPLLRSLKTVIVAGEACSGEVAAGHHRRLPDVNFYNEYGPTEATVWSSVLHSEPTGLPSMLPIGRAIDQVQIYILDRHHQPVPVGVSGELYIGGAGLAGGYLNQPAMTADKFMPNPFSPMPGSRLYKTGDLGCFRANGSIEFLGRIDNQVKIRGYRIEPGEIESRLLQYPGINEAAVVVREDKPGNHRLTAYIVAGQPVPETQVVQSYLRQSLPDYMVPPVFISLDKLPLTPNGKLDRNALPQPEQSHTDGQAPVAPRNAVEQTLMAIWSELLGIGQLSIHDNFFNLGGDSILSIQTVSRAYQAGLTLTPRQLFQHQTIAELATAIIGAGIGTAVVGKIQAEQGRVTGAMPLTPIQHWFFELGLANPQHWNQAVLLQSALRLEPDLLQQAILQLVGHHDALRQTFAIQDGGWQAINQNQLAPSFLRVDLDAVATGQRQDLIETTCKQQQRSLNLTAGPLMSVVLFDSRKAGAQRLFWAIHHLVVDAVSWRILLEDLHTAYRQLADGQAVKLPPKTTSFKQWAAQLSASVQSEAVQKAANYWLGQPNAAPLPVDEPQGNNSEASTASWTVALNEAETAVLLQKVPAVYHTRINDILLAALGQSLADWSGGDTVKIDLESHGREALFDDIDLSRTVGWFSSVYPVLLALPPDREPGGLIKSVKEQLRQVPDNGIAYGLLRYLGDGKTGAALARQPAAQVIFNYLGRLDAALPADSPYQLAAEDSGTSSDDANRRAHEIAVIAKIQHGVLQADFQYSRLRFQDGTIGSLAQAFLHNLQKLIWHCCLPEVGGYTPSDFPLAQISQQELDSLALTPARIEDIYPLTPLQQGLVFHSLYAKEAGVYCILLGCRLEGALDVPVFKQAWQQTIDRHSILRTGFLVKDTDMPLQCVCRNVPLPWSELEWQHLSKEEQSQYWQDFQTTESQAGFDFATPPLMRLTLIRCANDRHYFAWSFHHLLQDGWSMSLLLKDVFDAYQALSAGLEYRPLATKPYRDYIAWLQQQDMQAAETYWRGALAGFTAPTPLFGDKKPAMPGGYGQNTRLVSSTCTTRLQAYAQHQRLTLNTLIQGAWAILLGRYSGEREVVFGVTVSGRPADLDGIEAMTGLFINTLPLRVQVPDAAECAVWLKQLLEQNMTLRQYEYTPLVNINGWSDIPAGRALFDSLLVFENYPADKALRGQMGGLSVSGITIKDQTNYPLTVTVVPDVNLEITLSYDQGYADEQAIIGMLDHFEAILESLANPSAARLADISLLTADEAIQLNAWNATDEAYPQGLWLHQLFEQQAEATPDAVAVQLGPRFLSYAELNMKANQLAHHLQGLGVGPDVLVGVCMERSLDMVVALLGILKAGGAYVPLDPSYPQERLDFMLGDVNPPVVLTQSPLQDKLAGSPARRLCLDTQWPRLAGEPLTNPKAELLPGHLAYCIYTSGSTGQPKGAAVPHQGILNRLQWMQAEYRLDASDRVLQKTPYSFDVSVWEFFWPLMSGATLVMAPPEQHKDSQAIIGLINEHRITTLHFVPSMLQAFLDTPGVAICTSLVRVICSGEALPAGLVRRFHQHSGAQLHNLYGPTEASVDVSYWPCPHDPGATVPIGKPIANITLHILDHALNPVPVGIPGELHIGGIGLARGYLNRAGLSAEKFIPDPFGTPGGRLYKTGDLCRRRADGDIEYLGRLDHQVKIRGFRIELGEIEARLQTHPDLKEAAVLAREEQHGGKSLVAYLVADPADSISAGQLRGYLGASLPDYMVPSAFVFLDALPLSANGKLDRKALPAPDRQAQRETVYAAPGTAVEEVLAAIWADVLGVEQAGIDDNFFALGGDSIRSLQVINLAKGRGIEISLEQLYRHGTIRSLAIQAVALVAPSAPPQVPFGLISEADRALLPDTVEDAYPLSTLQAGMIFHSEYDNAAYHLVDSIDLRSGLDAQALQTAIRQTTARHPALRTAFAMGSYSEPLQLVYRADAILADVTIEDWRDLSAGAQQAQFNAWLEQEKSKPFSISKAPLIRFHVHQFEGDRVRFTVTEHHAILDGWSLVSMLNEIFMGYRASLDGGRETAEPPPANALRDLVVWERTAVQSEAHRQYWRQRLADAAHPTLPSAAGVDKESGDPAKTKQLTTLSPELTHGLQALAKSLAVPLKTVLLAAHLKVLGMLYGERNFTSGLVCSIRPETADADKALGVFLNTLPFPIQLGGGMWRDLILQVFGAEQELLKFRFYPLAQLQQERQGAALFDAMFYYLHYHIAGDLLNSDDVEILGWDDHIQAIFTLGIAFHLDIQSGQLQLLVAGDDKKLSPAQVSGISAYFANVLEDMAANPLHHHDRQCFLPASEQRLLTDGWNDTAIACPQHGSLHGCFEQQAATVPDAVAIVFEGRPLSYAELNARANQLAHELIARGVSQDVPVAVCLDRSLDMMVALLGILKAGGAYVPLDPGYPEERIAYQLQDAGATVLVTQAGLLPLLPELPIACLCIDSDWPKIALQPTSNPGLVSYPLQLAYIIYTSGSTGQPKGVMVSHHEVLRLFAATQTQFQISSQDVWTMFHSYAFDFSVWEIWGALLHGGRLVIVPYWLSRSPEEFYRLLQTERVTVLNQTPSAFLQLMRVEEQLGGEAAENTLRLVIFGGEALEPLSLEPWFDRHGDQCPQLVNMYGITETTVHVTYRPLARQDLDGAAVSPIGRPISDLQAYLLDASLNLCPVNSRGELHVGGAGLARGYLNRPDLTAERFIPNPFGKPGSRLYKSGDVACHRPNGELEYAGRIDHQVKIRGFRIELGEIENRLLQHPEVKECVLLVREDSPGDQRLTAYIVSPSGSLAADGFNAYLKTSLPDYMLPNAYVFLDGMPLTANGKLDRKALPTPDVCAQLKKQYIAPRTATETLLAEIWAEVLAVERVGVDDHFFELGGHSLLATQLVSRMSRAFNIELPLKILFDTGTVEKLAEKINLAVWIRKQADNAAQQHDETDYEEIEL